MVGLEKEKVEYNRKNGKGFLFIFCSRASTTAVHGGEPGRHPQPRRVFFGCFWKIALFRLRAHVFYFSLLFFKAFLISMFNIHKGFTHPVFYC
jgi:hypothetical protein